MLEDMSAPAAQVKENVKANKSQGRISSFMMDRGHPGTGHGLFSAGRHGCVMPGGLRCCQADGGISDVRTGETCMDHRDDIKGYGYHDTELGHPPGYLLPAIDESLGSQAGAFCSD